MAFNHAGTTNDNLKARVRNISIVKSLLRQWVETHQYFPSFLVNTFLLGNVQHILRAIQAIDVAKSSLL